MQVLHHDRCPSRLAYFTSNRWWLSCTPFYSAKGVLLHHRAYSSPQYHFIICIRMLQSRYLILRNEFFVLQNFLNEPTRSGEAIHDIWQRSQFQNVFSVQNDLWLAKSQEGLHRKAPYRLKHIEQGCTTVWRLYFTAGLLCQPPSSDAELRGQ